MPPAAPMPTAADVLRAYIAGWLAGDADAVVACVADDVVDSDDGSTVAAEWDFACTAMGVEYEILGATVAQAPHGKLTRITEYRREPEAP